MSEVQNDRTASRRWEIDGNFTSSCSSWLWISDGDTVPEAPLNAIFLVRQNAWAHWNAEYLISMNILHKILRTSSIHFQIPTYPSSELCLAQYSSIVQYCFILLRWHKMIHCNKPNTFILLQLLNNNWKEQGEVVSKVSKGK